jgi:hypothetical protein
MLVCLFSTLSMLACVIAPGKIDETQTGMDCPAGQRFFNGECRAVCTTSKDCPSASNCMNVGDGNAVCLEYTSCAYLGSDTQCVGVGNYSYYTRSGVESRPYESDPFNANPYDITPYDDPSFVEGPYQPAYASDLGCKGNAHWITTPGVGDPACSRPHEVVRCRRINDNCALLDGTTTDFLAP